MLQEIKNAKPEEMEDILQAVMERYRQIYPDWEIMFLSLDKKENRNAQIDAVIKLLEQMKKI